MTTHDQQCFCSNPQTPHLHINIYPTRTELYSTDQWYHLMAILYKLGITVFY